MANPKNKQARRTSILNLKSGQAQRFLLKGEAYCRFGLPDYLEFDKVLDDVDKYLATHALRSVTQNSHRQWGVNHTIVDNKDGRYAWRPMMLVHPVHYVNLVNLITEKRNWRTLRARFDALNRNSRITCTSIPVKGRKKDGNRARRDRVAMIRQWWKEIEQRSIRFALEYEYVCHTDISDCYGSIYTHSIAWAMHGKRKAKRHRRDKTLLGNKIDQCLQGINEGQTNGIPQGSVLLDLVVELVLCYADKTIGQRAKEAGITDYRILRHRDDYRIFVNSPPEGERLLKIVSEVMYSLGLKLNPSKTELSDDVLTSVVKDDKIHWNRSVQYRRILQKHLMLIRGLSKSHPHSGSLVKALAGFDRRLNDRKKVSDAHELVSIIVDIALRNPRAYAVCASIVSKLLPRLKSKKRKRVLGALLRRFEKIPNTGHLQIWLQRFTYPTDPTLQYNEPVCELVAGNNADIWNSDWITSTKLKKLLNPSKVVNKAKLSKLTPTISPDEVDVFEPTS